MARRIKFAGQPFYFLTESGRSDMKYKFGFYLLPLALLFAASGDTPAQARQKSAPRADVKRAPQVDEQAALAQSPPAFPRIAYDERAWKPFESTDGGFTVAFPGKPGFHTQTVEANAGPLANQFHGLDIGVAVFAVTFADIPLPAPSSDRELIDHALDAGRDRALARTGGKLISESPLTLDGYIGRYILSSAPGSLTHTQSYFVGKRLYQIIVVTDDYRNSPAEDQKFFKDLINRFFTSFKLTRKTY